MSVYLVTGGAGFIGSNIVAELVCRRQDVIILDNFSTGRRQNLAAMEGAVKIIEGDIRDSDTVACAMQDVDYVLHQAALPSVQRSINAPITTNDVNVNGTVNVLTAARRAGVRRLVFASSSSVYGNSTSLPKHEDMPVSPLSPYAVSKLAAERYCLSFYEVYGLPTVAIRYFNVFGPNQDPSSQYSAVIPRMIAALMRDESPVIYGDGHQSRDFTYVSNVVEANLLACTCACAIGHVFNIACGEAHSLIELYHDLAAIIDSSVAPTFLDSRQGDIKHSLASIDYATKLLGYRPSVDWYEGLRNTVKYYQGGKQ